MKLATIRLSTRTAAVRIDDGEAIETGHDDIGALLAQPDWLASAAAANGPRHVAADLNYAPVVPHPEKIVCVGLNYRSHILEMGRELPEYPTLFAKFPGALVGAYDDIILPSVSNAVDWEAELAVVIGKSIRHANPAEAHQAIAGYSVLNDVTARDWQYRSPEWLQGKTFESTTPVGPYLLTAADFDTANATIEARIGDEVVQSAQISDLVFSPAALVAYLSTVLTLRPGDIIATGTPGGVGHARDPRRYLTPGAVVTTTITGLGECRNTCRAEDTHAS